MVSHWLGPTAALTCFAPKPFRGGPGSQPWSSQKLAPESLDLGLCNLLPSRWDPDELRGGVRFAYVYGLEAGPAQDIIPSLPPRQSREKAGLVAQKRRGLLVVLGNATASKSAGGSEGARAYTRRCSDR